MLPRTPLLCPTPPELILWNVVERHLDEAEFLFEQWESAISSPVYILDEVGATLEGRLLAHLHGVALGGNAVAERLLHPALDDEIDTEKATVAALGALSMANRDEWQEVLEALLFTQDRDLRAAIARAVALFDAPDFDVALRDAFEWVRSPREKASLLEILAARHLDPGPPLEQCLGISYFPLERALVEVIGRTNRRDLEIEVAKRIAAKDTSLRVAAIEAGLVFGFSGAWRACRDLASREDRYGKKAMKLVALLGAPADFEVIYQQLEEEQMREAALEALGYTGRIAAAERCIPFLESEDARIVKLAAEAIAAITGCDTTRTNPLRDAPGREDRKGAGEEDEASEEGDLVSFELDDLDADLVPDAVDELPEPDASAVMSWYGENRHRFSDDERYLAGKPYTPQALVQALASAPMRRRHSLGLELFIRSRGTRRVATDGFTERQRRHLGNLADLDSSELRTGFSG